MFDQGAVAVDLSEIVEADGYTRLLITPVDEPKVPVTHIRETAQ
jgi:hypothetical protein